jgi:hypothetical protein
MDDGIGSIGSRTQAVEIIQRTAVRLYTRGLQRPGALFRARHAENFMTVGKQFLDDSDTDESRSACYEYTHAIISDR